jgi:hypothetical protein
MALDVTTLKTEIRAAFDAESDVEVDPAEARQRIADALGAAIDKFVKTGTVTVASGIAVSTAGTAAAQTGATTATGTGTIS